jgi:hypothetical protein
MRHVLVVLALAGLAFAQECPSSCKPASTTNTALADARKALADAPKAEEKLPKEQLEQLTKARDVLMETAFAKAMVPTFEACGHAMFAAAKQEGSSKEAAALMKEMGATYCDIAKVFGAKCCEKDSDCCKDMAADVAAKSAQDSVATAKKLIETAMEECGKMTPEQGQRMQEMAEIAMKHCPRFKAFEQASKALQGAFEQLAKMGVPGSDGKNTTRDGLVSAALELQGAMCGGECASECEGCAEECEETETAKPAPEPARAS